MTAAKRTAVALAVAGVVGSVVLAPSAEAQSRRHGRRIVYVRHTSHGWYGFPYYSPAFSPFWRFDPYFGPHPGYAIGMVDMNAAGIHGVGAVEMNTKPGSAEVWVDGKFVAEAKDLDGHPSVLWLKEGVHRVVVYKGGHVNFEEEIDVRRGVYKELKVRLQKGDGAAPGPRDAKER